MASAYTGNQISALRKETAGRRRSFRFLLILPTGLLIVLSRSMFLGYWPLSESLK